MAPKAPYLKSIITGVALTLGAAGLVACERDVDQVDQKEVEGIVQKRLEEEKVLNENTTLKARVAELEAEVAELKAAAEEKATQATAAATDAQTATKPAAKVAAKPAPKKAATVAAAEKKEAVKNLKEKLTGGSGGK